MPINKHIVTHPGLNPLWESMERDRRQQQFAAIALIVLSLFSIVVGGLFRILTEQPLAFWRRQLREEPETIVWVYGLVTERMPFGFKTVAIGTLYFVEVSGETHTFSMKPAKLKLVTKTLNRVLPHAEFGYSPEREMKYRGEVTNFKGRDQFNQIK